VAAVGAALHAAGLVLALFAMRPGTPAAPLLDRLSYLAGRPAGWVAGWLVWMVCAVSLVAFLVLLARARPSSWTRAAAGLAAAGAAIDLTCDAAYAFLLPGRAAGDVSSFLRFEHGLSLASLAGANGLYSLAILAATVALPRTWIASRGLGALTFVGGALLAAAGFTGNPFHVLAGTAVTMPAFVAWTLTVAVAVRRE
jgi:hypothetical protein